MKNREIRYFLVRIPGVGPKNLQERQTTCLADVLSANTGSTKAPVCRGTKKPTIT
jgi:hypothetical protein